MTNILIIGATSAIAMACARLWVRGDAKFLLVGRDLQKLTSVTDDLRARGATATPFVLDMMNIAEHGALVAHAHATLGRLDVVLIAHGSLPDQQSCETDSGHVLEAFALNAVSTIAILTVLANHMAAQGHGTIAVISSVAGDRGRASNYIYGAAKAAVSTYADGLRGRLHKSGVHVLTIKPGFVDTPMTQGLKLPRALVVQPSRVAQDIVTAVRNKRDTLYTPRFWYPIMMIIRMIPDGLFKRLRF